jgi:hypothetical protein
MMYNTGIMEWFKFFRGAPAKWGHRNGVERALLVEAFTLLCLARLAVLALPFRWLAVSLGRRMKETNTQIDPLDLRYAQMVGQAVCSAANYTPWKSVCLPQAVAAQWMLKQHRVAGTVYLGVAKDETKPEKLAAHAWVRCGSMIITGREGHQQFTVVATFS